MRKIYIIIAILIPQLLSAQTIVPPVIDHDELWISQNNPYIVNSDVSVKANLKIGPGVIVKMGDALLDSFKVIGSLAVDGTAQNPVIFESLGEEKNNWLIQIQGLGHSYIKNAIIRHSWGGVLVKNSSLGLENVSFSDLSFCMTLEKATSTVYTSTFKDCADGTIYTTESALRLSDSLLEGNETNPGILVENNSNLSISSSMLQKYTNAILSDNSIVYINTTNIIKNATGLSVKLSDVKVGTSTFKQNGVAVASIGPGIFAGGEGNIFSPADQVYISQSEFIDSDTYDISNTGSIEIDARNNWWGSDVGPTKNTGNVRVEPWIKKGGGCCSNVLFIPGFEGSRLFIPGNQLWEPNRNADVEKLMLDNTGHSLNTVSIGGLIDKGLGYRVYDSFIKNMNQLVASGTIQEWRPYPYDWRYAVTDIAKGVLSTLESLAVTSFTKKVNIVAHSNGGLVAKAVLRELQNSGKQDLIDSIVFIAVPHLGTPKAIAALQYGYDQSILKGLILNKKTARWFGYNTPGAYGLLPSGFTPMAGGVASTSKDMKRPMALNEYLLNQANVIHTILDTIHFPNFFSITGWNIPTLSSLTSKTHFGDGTVIASSSNIFENGYFFNIGQFNKDKKKNISHEDITESIAVTKLVDDIVSKTDAHKKDYEKYITTEYPVVSSEYQDTVVRMFSPVDIHAYDSQGNHTGPSLHQAEREKEMDIEPGLFTFVDQDIVGSKYEDFMEVKTIYLPRDDRYTIKGIGTDTGIFTLETSHMNALGDEKDVISYANIPVIKDSVIELPLDTQASSSNLRMDVEGDGIFDITIKPSKDHDSIDIKTFLFLLKKIVPKFSLGPVLDKIIHKKIDQILLRGIDKNKEKELVEQIKLFKAEGYQKFIQKFILDQMDK